MSSASTLNKSLRGLDISFGLDIAELLKQRVSNINQFKKLELQIDHDEIFSPKRVEYSACGVFRITDDCRVVSTLYCRVVKLLCWQLIIVLLSKSAAIKQFRSEVCIEFGRIFLQSKAFKTLGGLKCFPAFVTAYIRYTIIQCLIDWF